MRLPLVTVALVGVLATACDGELVCTADAAFDGVSLRTGSAGLDGLVTGTTCLDDRCEDVQARDLSVGGLRLDGQQERVRLRLDLTGSLGGRVVVDEVVPLLPVYGADRRCGVKGRSRVVDVLDTGELRLGPATPGG